MRTRRGSPGIKYETLVQPDHVHASVYTDPAIFADEIERIFHRGWVFVGHASETPKPGDFRLKRLGLAPVIMVRDLSGEIRLLLNRCRHRGASVCQHERGNARSLRCSYHGWTYRLDGGLMGVPYPSGYDSELLFALPSAGLHKAGVTVGDFSSRRTDTGNQSCSAVSADELFTPSQCRH